MTTLPPLPSETLPAGIRSRFIDGINGLSMHVLEAGFQAEGRPLVLLLHGFPELAYSWRKIMPALAEAGFHVVAPDQRGYGRTTGWDADYDGDLGSFRMLNLVRDTMSLPTIFGWASIARRRDSAAEERIRARAVQVANRAGKEPDRRVDHGERGRFAAAQHEIAERDLLGREVIGHALVPA